MERGRNGKGLVRQDQVATVVPPDPGGVAGRSSRVADLRGPRLLTNPVALKTELLREARALGFDCLGITTPDAIPRAQGRLKQFLAEGAHGGMTWLAANPERRSDPKTMWRDVRSVI